MTNQGLLRRAFYSVKKEGISGAEEISAIMDKFRESPVKVAGDLQTQVVEDYASGVRTYMASGETEEIDLPQANVLKVKMTDDCWYYLRPSGTEPKIKFYFGVKGETREEAESRVEQLKEVVLKVIK